MLSYKTCSDVLTTGVTFIIGRNKNVPPAYLIFIEKGLHFDKLCYAR